MFSSSAGAKRAPRRPPVLPRHVSSARRRALSQGGGTTLHLLSVWIIAEALMRVVVPRAVFLLRVLPWRRPEHERKLLFVSIGSLKKKQRERSQEGNVMVVIELNHHSRPRTLCSQFTSPSPPELQAELRKAPTTANRSLISQIRVQTAACRLWLTAAERVARGRKFKVV